MSTEETSHCNMKWVVSPQITIQDSLAKTMTLPHNSERYKKLTVCYFICKDQQPFDTINDSGLLKLCIAREDHGSVVMLKYWTSSAICFVISVSYMVVLWFNTIVFWFGGV